MNIDLICEECTKVYSSKKKLKRHINENHLQIRNFECEFCKMKFKRKDGLKRHIRCIHLDKKFNCKKCMMRFVEKYKLRNHYNKVHKLIYCTNCDIIIGNLINEIKDNKFNERKNSFEKHYCIKKTFKCDFERCGKIYKKEEFLKLHRKTTHGIKKEIKIVKENNNFHKKKKSIFENNFFSQEKYGNKELNLKKKKISKKKVILKNKIFFCEDKNCLKTFKRISNYKTHFKKFHDN